MSEDKGAKIVELVAWLREDSVVEWEQVEECVADFPGWLRLVEMLRYPRQTSNMRVISLGSPLQYSHLSADKRQHLLEVFQPYALLLNTEQTPAQRALSLREAGIDVLAFCKENRTNGAAEVATAAQAVLAACQAEKTLLRGATKPEIAPNELLRPAVSGEMAEDSLLLPADAPQAEEPKAGLLRRIFQWRGK